MRDEEIRGVKESGQILEKILRAMKGEKIFKVATKEMCVVSGLPIPTKFKILDIDKYKGHSYTKIYLIMYYRKMATHVENDKLMIHCFQDNMSGASSKWYLSLGHSHIQCFQDLSNAFIKHYKYNMDMVPDRRKLHNMFQKGNESFKKYAQQWRELASQVYPPLVVKELDDLFMDMVQPTFYDKMMGSVLPGFSDLIGVGMRTERG